MSIIVQIGRSEYNIYMYNIYLDAICWKSRQVIILVLAQSVSLLFHETLQLQFISPIMPHNPIDRGHQLVQVSLLSNVT